MTTTIEEQELEFELQELYLTGKQWLSDIDFLDDELTFVTALTGKLPVTPDRKENPGTLQAMVRLQADGHALLKTEIANYMTRLEPLILNKSAALKIQLIEDYCRLNKEVNDALLALKELKYACLKPKRPSRYQLL